MSFEGNGTSSFASSQTSLTRTASYSYAFWYKAQRVPGVSSDDVPFSYHTSWTTEIAFVWSFTNPSYTLSATHRHSDLTQKKVNGTTTPAADTWHHIAITYDNTAQQLKIWINGVNEATTTSVEQASMETTPITLLAFRFGSGNYVSFDDGKIAHLAIWDIALAQADIEALAAGTRADTMQSDDRMYFHDLTSTSGWDTTDITLSADNPPLEALVHGSDTVAFDDAGSVPEVYAGSSDTVEFDDHGFAPVEVTGTDTVEFAEEHHTIEIVTGADTVEFEDRGDWMSLEASGSDGVKFRDRGKAFSPYIATGRRKQSPRGI